MAKKKRVNRSRQELMTDLYLKSVTGKIEENSPCFDINEPTFSYPPNSRSVSPTLGAVPGVDISVGETPVTVAPLLLTVPEVCAFLRISRSTLTRMECDNLPPGRLKIGSSVRYHRETVENWVRDKINSFNITQL